MSSLLNKLTGSTKTHHTENMQPTSTTAAPHRENLHEGNLREEPRYQENVFENNVGRSRHDLGHENLRRDEVPVQNNIAHENVGSTGHGRHNLASDNLGRHDAPIHNNVPRQGHGTGRTGPVHNAHENNIGRTNHGLGHENLRQNEVPVQGNIRHENVGTTGHGRHDFASNNLGRHDVPAQSNIRHENVHPTDHARHDLASNSLGRHDIPAQSGHHSHHSNTIKTGPVHNSEMLNKLDPRVHEHKDRTAADHTLTGTTHGQAPLDAARVPPSVMQEHLGPPTIEHDFPHDSKHKRHSVSHQEAHIMR
ncbi:unnamed protein product [Clonostachys chloroleuca]|uniref:Uncharacterized protein n=1 Tax=Clonostachys chloroleuca TaxID=1926264 RepID=A0AA35Q3S7_9HYPO|nr:unnamed protein product [Clonostachys chloroleuca]